MLFWRVCEAEDVREDRVKLDDWEVHISRRAEVSGVIVFWAGVKRNNLQSAY